LPGWREGRLDQLPGHRVGLADHPADVDTFAVALLLKATAMAAQKAPQLNSFWIDGHFVTGAAVHLGVAISLRGAGLVAPAIHSDSHAVRRSSRDRRVRRRPLPRHHRPPAAATEKL
jgi:pyruvate/2-oxoglutarate dehydrogenase complex dihydrolipoamide acyltransferase (E2) component